MLLGYRVGGSPVDGSSLVTACDMVLQKSFRLRILIVEKRSLRLVATRSETTFHACMHGRDEREGATALGSEAGMNRWKD